MTKPIIVERSTEAKDLEDRWKPVADLMLVAATAVKANQADLVIIALERALAVARVPEPSWGKRSGQ